MNLGIIRLHLNHFPKEGVIIPGSKIKHPLADWENGCETFRRADSNGLELVPTDEDDR